MKKLLSLCLLSFPYLLFSQSDTISFDQLVDGSLEPVQLQQPQWRGSSQQLTYVDRQQVLRQRGFQEPPIPLVSLETLNQKLRAHQATVSTFPDITWHADSAFHFWVEDQLFAYELDAHQLTLKAALKAGASERFVSPQFDVAYTLHHDLWLYRKGGNYRLSTDGSRERVYGQAAHRQEFGIDRGIFWSPDGQKLAFYRVDQRQVADYPLVDHRPTPARAHPIKYPMAGQPSQEVQVGIYDLEQETTVYLKTGQPADQYLTNLSWQPDGSRMYVALVNREQDHLMLNAYDAQTGKFLQTLFEESDTAYVEPQHGLYFFPDQSRRFLWLSERDGYQHLYLYRTNGHLQRQLTRGPWEVTRFLGFNENGSHIFFEATKDSPLERHVYSLDLLLPFAKPKRRSEAAGVHQAVPSADGSLFMATYSGLEVPHQLYLQSLDYRNLRDTVFTAADPLAGLRHGQVELLEFRADDGTKLHARMIKPADVDTTQVYPALVYVYGGPHIQLVNKSWLGDSRDLLFLHYLASQGYIVLTLDNRGSAYRGKAFEQATFRQLGKVEVADQMKGVHYLQYLPYVDSSRIGVYGGSYGGFMALSLMTQHPEAFKAGVARGPVTDWKFYEVMYTERYMDTPQTNPAGYTESSVLNHVGKLKGKLLLMHGMQDSTVVPQHSMSFIRACTEQGIPVDFYPYPNHAHSIGGKDRVDFYRRIYAYLKEHL